MNREESIIVRGVDVSLKRAPVDGGPHCGALRATFQWNSRTCGWEYQFEEFGVKESGFKWRPLSSAFKSQLFVDMASAFINSVGPANGNP